MKALPHPDRLHLGALCLATVLVLTILWMAPGPAHGWTGLGRLHPVLVHFPIAFLALGALLDLVASDRRPQLQATSRLLWIAGVWSALPAVVAGHLLSRTGSYDPVLLERHQWAAIGLVLAGVAGSLLRTGRLGDRLRRAPAVVLLVFVGLTGHGGGALTHGPGYLGWWSRTDAPQEELELAPLSVFSAIIQPIFTEECISCHGPGRAEAGLRLDSYESIQTGGKHGPVLTPGKPEASEIYRRVTLPPGDRDRMPPEGPLLGVGDTELLRWWITLDSSLDLRVAEVHPDQMPSSVRTALGRLGRLGPIDPLAGLEAVGPLPPDFEEFLASTAIPIRRIAEHRPFLEVNLSRSAVTAADLEQLDPVAGNVVWLNLAGSRLDPGAWELLRRFTHLRRLHLERSNASSADLASLTELHQLTFLNLYGTGVTDEALTHLAGLRNLSDLYLWQTSVTQSGIQELVARNPRLKVSVGF